MIHLIFTVHWLLYTNKNMTIVSFSIVWNYENKPLFTTPRRLLITIHNNGQKIFWYGPSNCPTVTFNQ